eukprot:328251-Pelagomonas_calceolata.AAC.4
MVSQSQSKLSYVGQKMHILEHDRLTHHLAAGNKGELTEAHLWALSKSRNINALCVMINEN